MKNIAICVYTTNVSILKDYICACPKLKNITLEFGKWRKIHRCLLCNQVGRLYRNHIQNFTYRDHYRCDKCDLADSVVIPIPSIVHKLFV